MVIYGVDITGSLFVSGSSNFKGDINVSGSQIVSGSLNVLNSLLLNGQPFVGTQGPQGIQGSIGIQGTTGSNGVQGNQGPTGLQGTTGAQGNQGPTGLQGSTGVQGNQGPTGIQGTNGTVGTQGNQGPTGLQGSTGLQGNQGSTGASAGITSYTNPSDNRVLTSVSSTSINAESNLTFNGSTLTLTGNAVISSVLDVNSFIRNTDSTANSSIIIAAMGTSHYIQSRTANNSADTNLLLNPNGANVGIGTTSPVATLDLGASGENNIILRNTSNAYILGYLGNAGGRIDIGFSNSNGSLVPLPYLSVNTSGNVGIGTTSPISKLDINSSTNALNVGNSRNSILALATFGRSPAVSTYTTASNYLQIGAGENAVGSTRLIGFGYSVTGNTNQPAYIGYIETAGANLTKGDLIFGTRDVETDVAPTERMRITSGGNVGIGTTSPVSPLTVTSLNSKPINNFWHVTYFDNTPFATGVGGGVTFGGLKSASAASFELFAGMDAYKENATSGNAAGALRFHTQPASGQGLVEWMRITSTGNVGIGTATPSQRLEIADGDILLDGTSNPMLRFGHGANITYSSIYRESTTGKLFIRNDQSAGIILDNSNVGIGTNSPNFKIHISTGDSQSITQPTANTYGLYIQQNTSGSIGGLYIQDGASNSGNSIYVGDNNGNARFIVNTDGNVGIGTASPTSNLSFDGSAVRTIGMERVTASNTAGNSLTISASSATVGATDKNGGDMILSGGAATGTGSSRVVFRTATPNFSSGTGDRTPSDKVIITGSGTIIQNGVSSTFVTGTCLANQSVNLGFTTVLGGRVRVHAIITPTDGTSIGAQKMSVIANSTGGISEVVISNTTTTTIGSWTFSGSGEFFGVTKNAGSASTACTYLIEVIGNLA